MSVEVRDNRAEQRYEVYEDGRLAGFTTYELEPDRIAFVHTEVDPAFSGRGLAKQLVTSELEDARKRSLAVLPLCPYVLKIIAAKPSAYLDLVPAGERARFQLPAG